ncbi:MAG TPA: hypothetical protein ENK43_07600 [Planctomycetes bacterium]|nr:hypothetical protein [Planctomycetota bacterium]
MIRRVLIVAAALCLASLTLQAQQANSPLAELSINGTGVVDAMGQPVLTESELVPSPTGSAPRHHRAAARSLLRFQVRGTPQRPLVLLSSPGLAPTPLPVGSDVFDLDLATTSVVLDGITPSSLLDFGTATDFLGVWNIDLNAGLPAGFPTTHFQAVLSDPTAPPFGLRFTGAVTLDVRDDIETLLRNFMDGATQILDNPNYMPSVVSPTFLHKGAPANALFAELAQDRLPIPGGFTHVRFDGFGPDTTTAPPLPTGAPAVGQTEVLHLDYTAFTTSICPSLPEGTEQVRLHRIQIAEEAGVWKILGNQDPLELTVKLSFYPDAGLPAGFRTILEVKAKDLIGQHGGVLGVVVTGPQLLAVNAMGQSLLSATGTKTLTLTEGAAPGPTKWLFTAALGEAGFSRQPQVEDATGPRDVYDITVTFVDGTMVGPFSFPLRAAVDADANPADVLAALPGFSGTTGVLTNPGLAGAMLNFTFDAGLVPNPALDGSLEVEFFQGALEVDYDNLPYDRTLSNQTLNLCAPFLQSGVPTQTKLHRVDLFGNNYTSESSLVF